MSPATHITKSKSPAECVRRSLASVGVDASRVEVEVSRHRFGSDTFVWLLSESGTIRLMNIGVYLTREAGSLGWVNLEEYELEWTSRVTWAIAVAEQIESVLS
jgi:hypothetical protein